MRFIIIMTDLLNTWNDINTKNIECSILVYLFILYIYFLYLVSCCSLWNPLQSCCLSHPLLVMLLSRSLMISMLINTMVSLSVHLTWLISSSDILIAHPSSKKFSLDFQNKTLLFSWIYHKPYLLISFVGLPFSWFINDRILQN